MNEFSLSLENDISLITGKCPDLKHLSEVLEPIQYDYYTLGVALEIEDGELKSIHHSVDDDTTKLHNTLSYWTSSCCSAVTWENIIVCVREPPISKEQLAEDIEKFLARDDIFKHYLKK